MESRKEIVLAEQLFGHTTLADAMSGVVFVGRIALISDFRGRSEIHIMNDETGKGERLVFTTGSTWMPVMQTIQVIRETHTGCVIDVNPPDDDPVFEVCPECGNARQLTDVDGNWLPCPMCTGAL